MTSFKILVTGATGYIGGTLLSQLLNSQYNAIRSSSISGLVRGKANAKTLSEKGIHTEIFSDLDASDELEKIASGYDMVIQALHGYHPGSAKALILGLGARRKSTGKDVYYIHTSGTSNLGDRPITGKSETHVFSDKENIYAYEKARNEKEPYGQRTTDLTVVETGLAVGVKTYIIMSPLIYGIGTGHFNQQSVQIPSMIRAAFKTKQAEVIGSGQGQWDHVHIADLAVLYEILVRKLLVGGEGLPSGEEGIYFSATGHHTWLDIAEGLAGALFRLGVSETKEVRSISLEEAAEKWWGAGDVLLTELGFASNSRTEPELSRGLGWTPQKTDEDFKNHFQTEVEILMDKNK